MRDFIKIFEKNRFSEKAIALIKRTINLSKMLEEESSKAQDRKDTVLKNRANISPEHFDDIMSQISKESKASRDKISQQTRSMRSMMTRGIATGSVFTGFGGEQLDLMKKMKQNPTITEQIEVTKQWWAQANKE